jgi:hypothetical protein
VEELQQFILKNLLFMMYFLSLNIGDHSINFGGIDREDTITILPIEISILWSLSFNPFGRVPFDFLNEFHLTNFPRQGAENMDMITISSYLYRITFKSFTSPTQISPKFLLDSIVNEWLAIFGGKGYVDIDLRKRLRHCVHGV